MKVVSYNLRKHRAARELEELVASHEIDLLCVQEADTDELSASLGDLRLAQATRRNRLGLAVYYRENSYRVFDVMTLELKRSLHDRVLSPAHERLLGVKLRDIDHGRDFVIASFHAAPLTARNAVRREQIEVSLRELSEFGSGSPVLMVGDFNYPYFKERLSQEMRSYGYELSMSDTRTYLRYRWFKGFYDFAASLGFTISSIQTLPRGSSDHLPILVSAEFSG